jgi:8-oxo-dGTP pyrophosphatase MutT (NUDIX family)
VTSDKPAKQIAALPFRKRRGRVEILLITSRETKRWIIPKGWPMAGLKDYNAARREALEEAGVKGRVGKNRIGRFSYQKQLKRGAVKHCAVDVYQLEVTQMLRIWLEKAHRTRCWFDAPKAILLIQEPRLKQLISDFSK